MKDSEDPKGKRPTRKPGPQSGDKGRSSGVPARRRTAPKQTPHIPGTLSRDGTPKEMPKKRAAATPKKAATPGPARQTAPKKSAGTRAAGTRTGTRTTGTRTTLTGTGARTGSSKTQPNSRRPGRGPGTKRSVKAGTAKRQARPAEKLSPEELVQRARRKRQIFIVIGMVIVIALIAGVAAVVRGQLADREEQIVAQSEDTSHEVVPCEPSMLDIALNRTGSIAGYPVTFGLTVTNVSEQPCSLDAGAEHLVMDVTSGNDHIWSSGHCRAGAESRLYVFGPGVSSNINVEWGGNRSNEECTGGLPNPRPGTYVVQGSIDGERFPQLRESFVLTNTSGQIAEPEETEEPEDEETEETPAGGDETPEPVTEESPPPDDYIPD